MQRIKTLGVILSVSVSLSLLGGCAAVTTAISKRNLDVQTKMSSSIFLDPVSPSERTVFVDVRNTSDKDMNVTQALDQDIQSHGYKIVNDPAKAHFMLQANILRVGKVDAREKNELLASGYGAAFSGAALGAIAGASMSNYDTGTTVGVGLAGAAVGVVANAMVKDNIYTMVTDVQVKEKLPKGETAVQDQNTNVQQGTGTQYTQHITGIKSNWKLYRTRVVSTAEKVNLDFPTAKPKLEQGLAHSLAGLF